MTDYPSLEQIRQTSERLAPYIVRTPLLPYYGIAGAETLPANADVHLKMELLQRTGSFKARGALNTVMQLPADALANGVTAFSAGNHAIAVAFAARSVGTTATVVMPESANPYRVQCCRELGAKVVFGSSIADLMDIVKGLQQTESRTLVHPFEGPHTFAGTATIGVEICNDLDAIDAVVVPIGGGGLIAGIASAVKQRMPDCKIIGVEPEGANGMAQSLKQGAPLAQVDVATIADSLGAPMHLPQSFAIVRECVDSIVTVTDQQLRDTMRLMFTDLNICAEPACAAALCGLQHPLKQTLHGQRIAILLCGSNIDHATYKSLTG